MTNFAVIEITGNFSCFCPCSYPLGIPQNPHTRWGSYKSSIGITQHRSVARDKLRTSAVT